MEGNSLSFEENVQMIFKDGIQLKPEFIFTGILSYPKMILDKSLL
jgi:hypothetical protein